MAVSGRRTTLAIDHLQAELGISMTAAIIRLASQYGRYGYRRITGAVRANGVRKSPERKRKITQASPGG